MARAGKRKRLVTIRTPSLSQGTDGGLEEGSPTTNYISFAYIETANGSEVFRFAQRQVKITHRVELAYNASITEQMEIVEGSRIFDIQAVLHDEDKRKWTHAMCEERT